MARPLRIAFSGALYHVTGRGDRREAIFDDHQTRSGLLRTVAEVVDRFNWLGHAYGSMALHHRLVAETLDSNLSNGMRQFNGGKRRRPRFLRSWTEFNTPNWRPRPTGGGAISPWHWNGCNCAVFPAP